VHQLSFDSVQGLGGFYSEEKAKLAMPSASALRLEIEHALEHRFPAALTPAPRGFQEVAPTGIDEVDELLGGGIPIGTISELTGPESSGRTSLALAFLARCTQQGRACAIVDAQDAFDPESAAASGVRLKQLLWVRCRGAGMRSNEKPWSRLDQALRATDLLLQSGGFAAIVLDLGGTTPEHGSRIPLATWFRFRQTASRTQCSLVVIGQAAMAQSSAAVVLECMPMRAQDEGGTVLNGFSFDIRRARAATSAHSFARARKPVASTWSVDSAWAGEMRA
jgi:hypothetical protein